MLRSKTLRLVLNTKFVIETSEHGGQHFRQILRDQPGPCLPRALAVHPHADAGGLVGRHALRQKPRDHAGQHVAGAGGGQPRRRVGRDAGASIGRCHHRIRPLQQHHRARTLGSGPDPFEFRAVGMLVADIAEQPWKLAFMRGEDDLLIGRRLDRFEQTLRRPGKARQRVGVEHEVTPATTMRCGRDRACEGQHLRPARSRRH